MTVMLWSPAWQAGAEQQGILREGAGMLDALEGALGRWEVRRLLGGAYDRGPAMLSIQVLTALLQRFACSVLSPRLAVVKRAEGASSR